jgi:hypothetical protein
VTSFFCDTVTCKGASGTRFTTVSRRQKTAKFIVSFFNHAFTTTPLAVVRHHQTLPTSCSNLGTEYRCGARSMEDIEMDGFDMDKYGPEFFASDLSANR